MRSRAQVVIVGGGIVGCSVAYHLAELGWSDVVVLEQGQLSCGTTWHAAGLVGQLRSTESMTRLIRYSTDLYARLERETGFGTGWKRCGSVSVARTPERMTQLRRTAAQARAYGIAAEVVTAREAGELWPVMRTDDLVGGVWLPGDGKANPSDLTQALARGAQRRGVEVVERARVTGTAVRDGRVRGVETATPPAGRVGRLLRRQDGLGAGQLLRAGRAVHLRQAGMAGDGRRGGRRLQERGGAVRPDVVRQVHAEGSRGHRGAAVAVHGGRRRGGRPGRLHGHAQRQGRLRERPDGDQGVGRRVPHRHGVGAGHARLRPHLQGHRRAPGGPGGRHQRLRRLRPHGARVQEHPAHGVEGGTGGVRHLAADRPRPRHRPGQPRHLRRRAGLGALRAGRVRGHRLREAARDGRQAGRPLRDRGHAPGEGLPGVGPRARPRRHPGRGGPAVHLQEERPLRGMDRIHDARGTIVSITTEAHLWGGESLLVDGEPVGYVTSAAHGPTIGRTVALGFVTGTPAMAEVDCAGERYPAQISRKAPYDPTSARVKV